MNKIKFISTSLVALALLTLSNISLADGWPASVAGIWKVNANNSVGNLVITFQSSTGLCRQISGSIFGDPIQGYYCPFSGRIHFLRKNAATNDTFQPYEANLSMVATGPLKMGGSFSSDTGSFGEYSFFASK